MTLKQLDTSPAYVIFNRFMKRLEERSAYANELLKNEHFEFTGDDRVLINRKDQPFPRTCAEARQLWRERLRYEYLQEKLNKESRGEIARLMASRYTPIDEAFAWHDFNADIVKIISRRYSRIQRNFRDWESDKVLQTYLTSLSHVYDPHSDYFDKVAVGKLFHRHEPFAVRCRSGAYLGRWLLQNPRAQFLRPGGIRVKNSRPTIRSSPSPRAPMSRWTSWICRSTKWWNMIRGPKGTEVRLTIIPADASDPSTRTRRQYRSANKSNSKTSRPRPRSSNCPMRKAGTMRAGHH